MQGSVFKGRNCTHGEFVGIFLAGEHGLVFVGCAGFRRIVLKNYNAQIFASMSISENGNFWLRKALTV